MLTGNHWREWLVHVRPRFQHLVDVCFHTRLPLSAGCYLATIWHVVMFQTRLLSSAAFRVSPPSMGVVHSLIESLLRRSALVAEHFATLEKQYTPKFKSTPPSLWSLLPGGAGWEEGKERNRGEVNDLLKCDYSVWKGGHQFVLALFLINFKNLEIKELVMRRAASSAPVDRQWPQSSLRGLAEIIRPCLASALSSLVSCKLDFAFQEGRKSVNKVRMEASAIDVIMSFGSWINARIGVHAS